MISKRVKGLVESLQRNTHKWSLEHDDLMLIHQNGYALWIPGMMFTARYIRQHPEQLFHPFNLVDSFYLWYVGIRPALKKLKNKQHQACQY
ncbi:hypothetical protein [Dongshaea marina]|uniref:hypothetical protein n=1 Tax=Dongshaea marina TaxID=2047966 RepID=UPI00131ED1F4|nr:hypothetical protein [Dongshaea marina]